MVVRRHGASKKPEEVGKSYDALAATGGKGRRPMSKKITYTDGPIGDIKVVRDVLPPPSALAFREEQVKVTN
jgi:hypothetical protein